MFSSCYFDFIFTTTCTRVRVHRVIVIFLLLQESFDKLDSFLEKVKSNASDAINILIGCKCDLEGERVVTTDVAQVTNW